MISKSSIEIILNIFISTITITIMLLLVETKKIYRVNLIFQCNHIIPKDVTWNRQSKIYVACCWLSFVFLYRFFGFNNLLIFIFFFTFSILAEDCFFHFWVSTFTSFCPGKILQRKNAEKSHNLLIIFNFIYKLLIMIKKYLRNCKFVKEKVWSVFHIERHYYFWK